MSNNEQYTSEKGKTVIVFSTYYNSPIGENYLLNANTADSVPLTGDMLCNFLWSSIVNDKINGQGLIQKIWNSYLKTDGKDELSTEIKRIHDAYFSPLLDFMKNHPDIEKAIQSDVNEIDYKNYRLWKAHNISLDFENELETYQNGIKNAPYLVLKEKKGTWISKNLRREGQQDAYETKFPSNYNPSSIELADKPLLSYRFSYYMLKDCTETDVYAVWPLDTPANDANEWINGLSEQFGKDAEQLYLILHAKDIDPTIVFDVTPIEKYGNADRFVALFQHTGHIGDFLKREYSVKEVHDFVEDNVKNYYYLRHALKHIKHYDFDNMQKACCSLSDKYINIKEIADRFTDNNEIIKNLKELVNNALDNLITF